MFYDRFDELCKKKGVKVTNACVEAGLSRGLAAKWKAEKTEVPRSDVLQKLSVYFGMTIDEILGKEAPENAEKPTTLQDGELSERELEFIEGLRRLASADQDTIYRMIKSFSSSQE